MYNAYHVGHELSPANDDGVDDDDWNGVGWADEKERRKSGSDLSQSQKRRKDRRHEYKNEQRQNCFGCDKLLSLMMMKMMKDSKQ